MASRPATPPSAGDGKAASSDSGDRESVRNSPVTVVGIGASAGGLEALSELFRNVPADTALAYVVVQHLSPTHGSILAELLARQATIPVHQAVNGDRVEVNHAYVIAPDTKMTLTDGHLKLVPRDPDDRPPLPIDAFFRSLAEVQERRTIGVILSGTGSDGALGVRAIRGAGGIAFAQDPATATAEGMPRSAIATACIDIIATPAAIATHIAQLGRNPYLRPQGDGKPLDRASDKHRELDTQHDDGGVAGNGDGVTADSDALSTICAALKTQFGVDFDLYKMGTVERRIQRRMALRRIDTVAAYADMVRGDANELSTLYSDLLIGVTRFFRDPDLFNALSTTVLPDLIARRMADGQHEGADSVRDDSAIRVWVAGCSTGEEAYSIAICLLELLEAHAFGAPIQIFATDLNAAAISAASTGMYPRGIEADVTPERLNRFFRKEDTGYCVTKAVRDCCVFAVQNITADPPFSHLDVVSCRNVLIYLQPNAHTRLLSVFHYALRPGGILVLGTSESVSTAPSLFTAIDKKRRIYTRIPGPVQPLHLTVRPAHTTRSLIQDRASATAAAGSRRLQTVGDLAGPSAATPPPDVQRAADQIVLGSYAPAAVVVDDQLRILQFRGRTGKYIEPAAGTASLQLLSMVKPDLATDLRMVLETARNQARPARVEGVSFHDGKHVGNVSLDVRPFRVTGSDAKFFIISFEESRTDGTGALIADAGTPSTRTSKGSASRRGSRAGIAERKLENNATELGELRQDLEAANRHLQSAAEEHASVVEEFQAANEEIQSSNEELQSTNEEIETSKEELQSLNEELITLNDELRGRNTEADHLNDDLKNLLSAMHVPVIMVGTDLHIRRFTAGAERMMNVIPTDIGRPIGHMKSNIDVGNIEELIRHVIDSLEVTEREVRDGAGHWYMMHIRPYRTVDNKIDGAVIVYHDIDARKRAAEQLDDARRFAEAIVQTVREPLLVLDGNLCGVSANPAFYDSFGVSAANTMTRSVFEFAGGEWNIPTLRVLLERVLRTGEPFDDVEVEHDFATGGHRTMLLNARRIGSQHNGPPLILMAIEDVTERKTAGLQLTRANAELVARADELEATSVELRGKTVEALASNRAKADFLATMSHELRTPLNAIAGYAQLIDMGIHGPVTAAQHADLIRITRSQEHLMGLINEILNYAKLEAGAVSISHIDVDVNEVLLGVREMMALQMERAGLRYDVCRLNVGDGPPLMMQGDADRMRQILLNLLSNALKFTRPGGTVEVTCDVADERVAIHVVDTGVGIAASQLSAIFEPFVQADTSLTRSAEGVGLGLAISRSLARAMGGDVTVESTVGIGSVFTLTMQRGFRGAAARSGSIVTDDTANSTA
jgi:two-component system, chemotaxis family, CheB/CheR fusion protein